MVFEHGYSTNLAFFDFEISTSEFPDVALRCEVKGRENGFSGLTVERGFVRVGRTLCM